MKLEIGGLPRELQRPFEQLEQAANAGPLSRFGGASVALAAATGGTVVVPHTMGRAPTVVVATADDPNYNAAVTAADATDLTFAVEHIAGSAATVTVTLNWIALG